MEKIPFHTLPKVYASEKLNEIDDNYPLLLAGYGVTDKWSISQYKQLWAKYDTSTKAVGRDEQSTKKVNPDEAGGAVTLFDIKLSTKNDYRILGEVSITTPMGLLFYPKTQELLIGSAYGVEAMASGRIKRRLNNNLFNSIHALELSKRGIYVTCSATDSVVEVDPSNPQGQLWDWLAVEHGINISPYGRLVDTKREINYQLKGPIGTKNQSTHLNGVCEFDDEHILVTLFHQDQLIKINKRTGDYIVVYDNLTNPHGIHRYQNGFIVCDTRGNRVVILDKDFHEVRVLEGHFDWVQDAIPFGDYLIVANDNKGRLDIYNQDFQLIKQIEWDTDQRMISVLYAISAGQAKKIFLS